MKLKNTYAVGTLIQFYEVGMVDELIDSYSQMLNGIENPQNVLFHFCVSGQEYLETCSDGHLDVILDEISDIIFKLHNFDCEIKIDWKFTDDPFYNIASYRRDFNYKYCTEVDFCLWGETDSAFPAQTFEVIETVWDTVKDATPKFILTFADRVLWDDSFTIRHPLYEKVQFQDNDEFAFNNEASGKSYMKLGRMNEINDIPLDQVEIISLTEPRFDGSCVVFSSDLLKSGVMLPHALIHNSEDVSVGRIAKLIMGDQFVQYVAKNLLHIHNRRHPNKRTFIENEDNSKGLCSIKDKGEWWGILENSSKFNYANLQKQTRFFKTNEIIELITKTKGK